MKRWGFIGLAFGLILSVLSILLAFVAPQLSRPGSFDDIVAVLLPILSGLLVAQLFLRMIGGEITSAFYVVGHILNIIIFVLIGMLIGSLFKKRR